MLRLTLLLGLMVGCGTGPALSVATFTCDATPPVGHPLAGKKPAEVVEEPLFVKGVVLDDGRTRVVLAAIDWCTLGTEVYARFRAALGAGAGTPRVAIHCTHTHSAPFGGGQDPAFIEALAGRLTASARDARPRPFTHVGFGSAKVVGYASNRRVPGPEGKIRVRYSSCKDPALREEPEGRVDPLLRTVTFYDRQRPLVRMHYYASHPQSFYGDGRVHPDVPGWARARLEREEGIPHLYFTGCGGDVTAGKYNDGSPEAREGLIGRLAEAMRGSAAASARHAVPSIGWKAAPVRLVGRKDGGEWPPVELSLLDLGPVSLLHLPGEPFVEFQFYAHGLRPGRPLAVAGYGDGGMGYICTDDARGGYEPTASRVGPPSERILKAGIAELLR